MAHTKRNFGVFQIIKNKFCYHYPCIFRLWVGKVIADLIKSYNMYTLYSQRNLKKHSGKLIAEEIAEITNFQVNKVTNDFSFRSRYELTDAVVNAPDKDSDPMQTLCARVVRKAISDNKKDIRSVVNIGARTDVVSSYLAQKFPDIEFLSVDFQPNLKLHNSRLKQSPNWTFQSGYALDLLENGNISGDLFFTTSTAALFNGEELNQYLDAFAKKAKFVIFNESCFAPFQSLSPFRFMSPEDLSEKEPFVGGPTLDYNHNYIKKLEKRNFEIVSSELRKTNGPEYVLLLVAKNKSLCVNDAKEAGQAAGEKVYR